MSILKTYTFQWSANVFRNTKKTSAVEKGKAVIKLNQAAGGLQAKPNDLWAHTTTPKLIV